LSVDIARARRYLDAGALFVAVGVDTSLLIGAAKKLAAEFMAATPVVANSGSGY
jgi:4-hydroxy-2-oxoheptanedioate aldolase